MEQRKNNFFMVDNTVFYVGLKPRDIAVYCFLCRMENREKGYAFPTRRHIARACGISKLRRLIWHSRSLFAVALLRKLTATVRSTDTRQTTIKLSKSTTIICRFELTPSSWWTEGVIENGDTINKSLTVI